MNCPKCVGQLEEKTIENTKVDVCWVCEGLWFDASELKKVLTADSIDFNNLDVDRKELDGDEISEMLAEVNVKTAECPRCQKKITLQKTKYPKAITIDTCPECKGVWLDGGEIHKLRDRTLVSLYDGIRQIKDGFADSLKGLFKGRRKRP